MKLLKMILTTTIEIVIPAGEISQEEIDELHSEKGQEEFIQGALEKAKEQAKANNGNVLDFHAKAEIIEV